MQTILERPTHQEQKIAGETLSGFAIALAREDSEIVKINLQETNEMFALPKRALELLSQILLRMAEGKSVYLMPSESEISTQQAAEILNVSRPHLVKLLEQGAIPFYKIGSHRRIMLEDILKYADEQRKVRDGRFQFLADQAQRLNLGYE